MTHNEFVRQSAPIFQLVFSYLLDVTNGGEGSFRFLQYFIILFGKWMLVEEALFWISSLLDC